VIRYKISSSVTAVVATVVATSLAGTAVAAHRQLDFTYRGISCRTDTATGAIACSRADGVGYIVGLSPQVVAVQKRWGKFVFFKSNVGAATRAVFLKRSLLRFNGIRCGSSNSWTIICARASNAGFAVAISRTAVAVVRLANMKRVFWRRNG